MQTLAAHIYGGPGMSVSRMQARLRCEYLSTLLSH